MAQNNPIRSKSAAKLETQREARTRRSREKVDNAGEIGSKGPTNKGLFAKAHRTLEMAGWSDEASDDPEIFRLVDADGLLPLLTILDRGRISQQTSDNEARDTTA